MPMPQWFGIRPNFAMPRGTATSAHARLTWIDGRSLLTPGVTGACVPLLNAPEGGRLPLVGSAYAPPSTGSLGVEPNRRLSSASAWMWTEVPSSRLIVGSSRSRMLALDSEASQGWPVTVDLQPSAVGTVSYTHLT